MHGLEPDTRDNEPMIIDVGVYRNGERLAERFDLPSAVRRVEQDETAFCWIGLHDPEAAELSMVADAFSLHPLAVEDASRAHQRPKLERYDDMLFAVLHSLWYVEDSSAVESGQIAVFVGPRYVITVRHGEGAPLHRVRADLEQRASVLGHGPGAVLYAVYDYVVDRYSEVADELATDVDEIEQQVFSEERTSNARDIYRLKREVIECRRAVSPLRSPLGQLASGTVTGVDASSAPFFRDVADHTIRVTDQVEELDNLLSSVLDAHLARISVQQNDDMRRITAWVAMAAIPTMIAGFYGMNFVHMPELNWSVSYPLVVLLMIVCCTLAYRLFKRSGWL